MPGLIVVILILTIHHPSSEGAPLREKYQKIYLDSL
jgi:hypothetical protein